MPFQRGETEDGVDTSISIVIPVFNEGPNVASLMRELEAVMGSLGRKWQVIWVNDGSTDDTLKELQQLNPTHAYVIHKAKRNGQSSALLDGLIASRGATIVTLDGDGQIDPADIPALLTALDKADFAIGWRRTRQDDLSKRIFSRLANQVRNVITCSKLPDSGCSLRAFRRHILADLFPISSLHRFLPTIFELSGRRTAVVPVRHRPRVHGVSKYGVIDRIISPLLVCLWLRCWFELNKGLGKRFSTFRKPICTRMDSRAESNTPPSSLT